MSLSYRHFYNFQTDKKSKEIFLRKKPKNQKTPKISDTNEIQWEIVQNESYPKMKRKDKLKTKTICVATLSYFTKKRKFKHSDTLM